MLSPSSVDNTGSLDSLLPSIPIMPSFLAGLQESFQCPCKADKSKSLLVGQHWPTLNPKENTTYKFIPASSAEPSMSCFALLGWFVRWEVSGHTAAVL